MICICLNQQFFFFLVHLLCWLEKECSFCYQLMFLSAHVYVVLCFKRRCLWSVIARNLFCCEQSNTAWLLQPVSVAWHLMVVTFLQRVPISSFTRCNDLLPLFFVFFFLPLFTAVKKSSMDAEIVVLFSDRMYFWCIFCSNTFSLAMCTYCVLTTSAALTVYKAKRKAAQRMQRICEKFT